MPRIRASDGVAIAYERQPGPDPVLLVHGFASSAELNWRATGWVRALEEAGRGSVLVDLRGHGGSDAPHADAAYALPRMAADLVAVLDAEGLAVIDAVGYSMGAQVVRVLENEHPHRVRRIVLAGIGAREQFATWGVEALRGALLRGEPIDDPVARELLRALAALPRLDREALAACVGGVGCEPLDVVPQAPVLVVAGEDDTSTEDAAGLAERLGAGYVPIPRRNHLNAISARAFKRAALDFLLR